MASKTVTSYNSTVIVNFGFEGEGMVSRNGLGLRIRPVPLSIQMTALPGERVFIQIIKEDKLLLVWSLSTVEHFKNYSCICSTSFGEEILAFN